MKLGRQARPSSSADAARSPSGRQRRTGNCVPSPRAGGGRVLAPLAQARHLLRHVDLLASLGLDDPDRAVRRPNDEVGRVVRQVAVGLDVVELEADSQVVLGEGDARPARPRGTRRTTARSRPRAASPTILLNMDFVAARYGRWSVRNGRVSRSRIRSSMRVVPLS